MGEEEPRMMKKGLKEHGTRQQAVGGLFERMGQQQLLLLQKQ